MSTKEKQNNSKIPDSVGFSSGKGEGYMQPREEQLESMKSNGFDVDKTTDGIIITPKTN
jgi:hypothetical protein